MKEILIIIAIQLVYVPIVTIRTIMTVKGKTKIASILGMIDVFIYITGLGLVLKDPSIYGIIVYAIGYGVGITLGGYIERKLAIGYTMIQILLEDHNDELMDVLWNEGFGLTVYKGEGRDGARYRIDVLTQRNRIGEVKKIIKQYDTKAFVVGFEPVEFQGGFMVKR